MKRRAIIYLIAVATFLSAFGWGTSLLATTPASTEMEPSVQLQQNHSEKTPTAIAGNSWGGRSGSDDTQKDPPKDGGGDPQEGNSWGG